MKKSRFSEEQIISVLKQQESSVSTAKQKSRTLFHAGTFTLSNLPRGPSFKG